MKVAEIYERYTIPESLQFHMLTVAALGKYIVDHWNGPEIQGQEIIATLLLHDLANIIKMDLSDSALIIDPNLHTPHWREIQQKTINTYGTSAHKGTQKIFEELGASSQMKRLAAGMDASNVCLIANDSLEMQICEYADLRVTPKGLTSLTKRLDDLQERYSKRYPSWVQPVHYAKNRACAQQIEQTLQQFTTADIVSVHTEQLAPDLVKLRQFEIATR